MQANKALLGRQVGTTTKGKVYRLVKPLIGDGLLASAGEEHARQRRTSELGFKLEALELTCATCASLMSTRYCPYVDAQRSAVDVYELMLKLTLDVLGEGA
jgi:cytochrome P450